MLESKTSFRFRARFDADLSPKECEATRERVRERLTSILAEKEMGNVRFEIEQVEALEIDPHSGKFRLVVREPAAKQSPSASAPSAATMIPAPV